MIICKMAIYNNPLKHFNDTNTKALEKSNAFVLAGAME